ncbi:hypothetical protein KCU81_g6011, partial [Aureobasidium melanogenum]
MPSLHQDFEKRFQARCKAQGPYGSAWDWMDAELRDFTKDYLLRSCSELELLIFVDALDECGEDCARELLDFFQRVVTASEAQNDSTLKICVSSRHYPLVRADVLFEVVVDGENSADIHLYVDQKLNAFRDSTQRHDELVLSIASRAGEIFQWSVLVVAKVIRSLEGRKPVELILRDIEETPQQLFQLYRQIVRSYLDDTNVDLRDKKQFSDLFQWVALAKRPLSVLELRSALLIDWVDQHSQHSLPTYADLYARDPFGADVEFLSCGLAKVVEELHYNSVFLTVEFIHHSVQDYFLSGGGLQDLQDLQDSDSATTARRTAELNITGTCHKSVLLSDADAHIRHPLLDYALEYIFLHARSAEEGQAMQNDLVQILNFPQDDCMTNLAKFSSLYRCNLLHVAARFDIPNLISSVLDLAPKVSINIRDDQHRTALHIAAKKGNHNVMDRLLNISHTFTTKSMLHWRRWRLRVLQLNALDSEGATPLMLAAQNGYIRIVEQLVQTQRAHLNAKNPDCATALHLAIEHGHVDIAKALIHHGANVRARDCYHLTPLSLALVGCYRTAPLSLAPQNDPALFWSILAQSKQELYLRQRDYESPYVGSSPLLKRLVDHVALRYPRWPQDAGSSPIEMGLSCEDSLQFAQGLLDQGFDPHTPDRYGCVWFSYLEPESNPETLDLLQSLPGANINFKDECGRTLLARLSSSQSHDCSMLKRLLEDHKVDIRTEDNDGKTPLTIAAEKGSIEVVKALLTDARSDPQARDKKNLCALDYARTRKVNAQDKFEAARVEEPHNVPFYRERCAQADEIFALLEPC